LGKASADSSQRSPTNTLDLKGLFVSLWNVEHGSVQGQVEWRSEQPGLVEDVPVRGRGFGTR